MGRRSTAARIRASTITREPGADPLSDLNTLDINEFLTIDHNAELSSNYNYQLTRQSADFGNATTQSLGAQVNEQVFHNLSLTQGLTAIYSTLPGGTISSAGVAGNFNYGHVVPWEGQLNFAGGGGYLVTSTEVPAGVVPVVDAPYVVPPNIGAGATIQLRDRNIVTDSIVVVVLKNGVRVTAVLDVDYRVQVDGDRTSLVPLATSALMQPGDPLNVSYVYQVAPSSKFQTTSGSASFGIDWPYFGFNYSHDQTDQTPLSGSDNTFLLSETRDAGVIYVRGIWDQFQARAGAGLTSYDSVRLSYTERRFDAYLSYSPYLNLNFNLTANESRTDYQNPVHYHDQRRSALRRAMVVGDVADVRVRVLAPVRRHGAAHRNGGRGRFSIPADLDQARSEFRRGDPAADQGRDRIAQRHRSLRRGPAVLTLAMNDHPLHSANSMSIRFRAARTQRSMAAPRRRGSLLLLCMGIALLAACGQAPVAPREAPPAPESLVWPRPPAPARIRFVKSVETPADWGLSGGTFQRFMDKLTGQTPFRFVRPTSVAARGTALYVADPGAQALVILDPAESHERKITRVGQDNLVSPVALALGPPNKLFLVDSALRKIFVIDGKGELLATIGGEGRLARPAGVAYDAASDRLYVSDAAAHRIFVFAADGRLVESFGSNGNGPGEFNFPTHLALTRNGNLIVTDTLNYRVQIVRRNGDPLASFGHVGDGSGNFASPKGVGTDSEGNFYVVDALFDAVQIFGPDGTLLLGFGERGTRAGRFWLPNGLFIDPQDTIYVADSYNQRISVFERVTPASKDGNDNAK